ncbi:MAG: UDP-N-acetylmuramate--L-alanine ligase [Elusimicrobiota bacterium]
MKTLARLGAARPVPNDMMKPFVSRVHFVGIGGAGMSAIAEVLASLGYDVSGSDLKRSETTARLRESGIKVHIGHRASNAAGAQVLVVSSAVPRNNPETSFAVRKGVPVIARAQMLAELGRMKKTVAVAGSHGKTTTASMIAAALGAAGAEPTAIIGGRMKNAQAAARPGTGEYLVVEADESDGSFVQLSPLVAVVTNIDDDHLDFHGSMDGLARAFLEYLRRLPFYGRAVLCRDDERTAALASRIERPVFTYGFNRAAEWRPRGVRSSRNGSRFDVVRSGRKQAEVVLSVPGRHNVLNALAALSAGAALGFDPDKLARGLGRFSGVGRRIDSLGQARGAEFVDDYGHHPSEIAATLSAVSELWKPRRLVVIFQPHRFSRTRLLAGRFGPAFKAADFVYVTPIYPAGEKPEPGISSKMILDSLARRRVACAPFPGVAEAAASIQDGDLVLTLGAGDVRRIGEDLLRERSKSGTGLS